ncbi:MAG: serine/threonine-protein kinase [Pseudomonadota bacterium]
MQSTMTPERWENLQQLFHQALDLPEDERASFVAQACGEDAELLSELQAMLAGEKASANALTGVIAGVAQDAADASLNTRAGQRLGAYRILEKIAQGGMGAVYSAERADDAFQQKVAVKILASGLPGDEAARRFLAERQILASLNHPNIARLLDGGTTPDDLPYLVMEYIEGEDIVTWCNSLRLSLRERLALFCDICAAIQFAHRNLIVHRDVKPSNIMVTADGVPKLLDFGIAKLLDPDKTGAMQLTKANQRMMTPEFASPEQVKGEPMTTATDVYSLGVLLYVMLAGRTPFEISKTGPLELPKAICEQTPTKPSSAIRGDRDAARERKGTPDKIVRQLRGDLDTIVLTAIRKQPDRRYATVAALADDVRRHLDGLPVQARPDDWGYLAAKFVRRHRVGVAATVAVLTGAAAFGAYHTAQLTAERDRATLEAAKAEQVADFVKGLFDVSDPGQSRGETITARELLEQGAVNVNNELADQPLVQATLMHTIGDVYARLGLYDESEPLLRQALTLRESQLGDSHRDVAISLRRLAWVVYLKGELDEAETLYRRALALDRELLGDNHVEVARSLDRLGHALYGKGDYDAAEALYREALAVQRELAEPDYDAFAKTLHDLGQVRELKGALDEAEALFREALAINRTHRGDTHPHTLTCLHDLAVVLGNQRKFADAEQHYTEALALSVEVLGEEHPDVGITMTNFGRMYHEQGNYADAEPMYRSALEISTVAHGEGHAYVAYDIVNLANLLTDLDKPQEAETQFTKALGIYADALPPTHPYIASALVGYARLLVEQQRAGEAAEVAQRALTICDEALPPDHWLTAAGRSVLGESLVQRGDLAGAEALLVDSYPVLRDARGAQDARTQRSIERLVLLYDAWDKPDRAAEYKQLLQEPALP